MDRDRRSSSTAMLARIRRMMIVRGSSSHDAEDLSQEAYARYLQADEDAEIVAPDRYVARTAVNLSINQHRRSQRWFANAPPLDDLEIVDDTPLQDEVLDARKRLEKLRAGFAALEEETRTAISWKKFDNMPLAEIAKRQGVSLSTIERRLARGLAFLSKWMEEA